MNKQIKNVYHLFLCLIMVVFSRCAQPAAPTGGPRDITPPKLVKSLPENGSVNFTGNEITLFFDEYIQIQNPYQNILISPQLSQIPKITAKKNEISIIFKEALKDSTTYSFFFGSAIKDVNESNPFENFQYAISTGAYIDSLSLEGNVFDYSGEKLADNIYVLLYKGTDDSAFVKRKPDYFYSTKDGSFTFEHLKPGQYQAFALSDKNNNYFYDLPTESIGFLDNPLNVRSDSSIEEISIPVFLPEPSSIKLTAYDRTTSKPMIKISFNKQISDQDRLSITLRDQQEGKSLFVLSEDKKSGILYLVDTSDINDEITVDVFSKSILVDSFACTMEKLSFYKINLQERDYPTEKIIHLFPDQEAVIHSNLPLRNVDTSKIILSDTTTQSTDYQLVKDGEFDLSIMPDRNKLSQNSKLVFLPGALTDVWGNDNDTLIFEFKTVDSKELGGLKLNLFFPKNTNQYVITVLDKDKKVIFNQIFSDTIRGTIELKNVIPGLYSVQVFSDENRDGVRTSGSFWGKRLPEKVFNWDKIINIKPNWDMEEDLDLAKEMEKKTIETNMPEKKEENKIGLPPR